MFLQKQMRRFFGLHKMSFPTLIDKTFGVYLGGIDCSHPHVLSRLNIGLVINCLTPDTVRDCWYELPEDLPTGPTVLTCPVPPPICPSAPPPPLPIPGAAAAEASSIPGTVSSPRHSAVHSPPRSPGRKSPVRHLTSDIPPPVPAAPGAAVTRKRMLLPLTLPTQQRPAVRLVTGVTPVQPERKQICVKTTVPTVFMEMRDSASQDLIEPLIRALTLIREAALDRKNVLVHCQAGKSRSASLVIGWIMYTRKIPYEVANAFVHSLHPDTDPNFMFSVILKSKEHEIQEGLGIGAGPTVPWVELAPPRSSARSPGRGRSPQRLPL